MFWLSVLIKASGVSTTTLPPLIFNMLVALNKMFFVTQRAALFLEQKEKSHDDRLTVDWPINVMSPAHFW